MNISHSVLSYEAVPATATRRAKPAREVDAYTAFCDTEAELIRAESMQWATAFKQPGVEQTFGTRMSTRDITTPAVSDKETV